MLLPVTAGNWETVPADTPAGTGTAQQTPLDGSPTPENIRQYPEFGGIGTDDGLGREPVPKTAFAASASVSHDGKSLKSVLQDSHLFP